MTQVAIAAKPRQLAEMWRAGNLHGRSIGGGLVAAAKRRRMRHDWAPAPGERQLNPAFIFNSAWEAQRDDVRETRVGTTRFKRN